MAISKGTGFPRSGGNLSDASAPMMRAVAPLTVLPSNSTRPDTHQRSTAARRRARRIRISFWFSGAPVGLS